MTSDWLNIRCSAMGLAVAAVLVVVGCGQHGEPDAVLYRAAALVQVASGVAYYQLAGIDEAGSLSVHLLGEDGDDLGTAIVHRRGEVELQLEVLANDEDRSVLARDLIGRYADFRGCIGCHMN